MVNEDLEKILKNGGVENYRQEAQWIIKYSDINAFYRIAKRRAKGEPLQYLLGEWEFFGRRFKVGQGVLIPRPETELLVDTLRPCLNPNSTVIDLCAGSGCVGIALAKETGCAVISIEVSDEALFYLNQNVVLNRAERQVKVIRGNIFDETLINNINQQLSTVNRPLLIAVNPPYLSNADMLSLQREVRYEPEIALYGGEDGLDFYRNIFGAWGKLLKQGEVFAVEIGQGQGAAVKEFINGTNLFSPPQSRLDFNNVERVIYAQKK